ncbi:MAG: hypothetical protein MUC97_18745 [Bernardetiaceae bacterium]|jgi:hypothetical protein|nr:hypothetical protein [Bernardetiaceae bacterium]
MKTPEKNTVVAAAKAALGQLIAQARTEMAQLLASATENADIEQENYLESNTEEMMNLRRQREQHLEFLLHEQNLLENIDPEAALSHADFGAVVLTDQGHFLVGAAVAFSVEGLAFQGISVQAPIFASMKGKKTDESFAWGPKVYQVRAVY